MIIMLKEREEKNKIFLIEATRCRRCGRLLTGKEAIERGMGSGCMCKAQRERAEREILKQNYSLFDFCKD